MNPSDLQRRWADKFGLALAPLFEANEIVSPEAHAVLLDGGVGSFAFSESDGPIWKDAATANWAWSSNIPHHVTVTDKIVAVRRWDLPNAEEFSRASVEAQIEPFYEYLTSDRVRSTKRVVDHVLQLFRRMRSLVSEANLPDEQSVGAFLAFLGELIQRDQNVSQVEQGDTHSDGEGYEALRSISPLGLMALHEEVRDRPFAAFKLLPSLAVRHAGSEIFQEAHFELLRAPGIDLFGYIGPVETKAVTRGGAHFTPAALARSIAEQAISQLEALSTRPSLTVLDAACGSGAFLQEALRTLRRLDFKGRLVLVGRDISPAAISMARFVLAQATADWEPAGGVKIDILVGNSLTDALPRADLILMNPPFIAWPNMNAEQRDQLRQTLGNSLKGRGDFSMAFLSVALDHLAVGGSIGMLLPSSLLTLQSAEDWRSDILEKAELRFLASLGDYGLFAHALVQIAAVVIAKPSDAQHQSRQTRAVASTNSADATGNALRALRRLKLNSSVIETASDNSWRLFDISSDVIASRSTWRLTSPQTEAALSRLLDAGAERMSSLFEVKQGVRTGDNKTFILDGIKLKALPVKERRYFKSAVLNNSIFNGSVRSNSHVFYPYGEPSLALEDEDQLKSRLPVYYTKYLLPNKDALTARPSLHHGKHWWDLSEMRSSWALDTRARIVSKYFGNAGGFAVDLDARHIVVQGFAWLPKWTVATEDDNEINDNQSAVQDRDILCAYAALMNSGMFGRVLELFSPHVAGGQFDLSPRYTDAIPVPNLLELSQDARAGRLVYLLSALGREPDPSNEEWRIKADRATSELYGGDFFDQV